MRIHTRPLLLIVSLTTALAATACTDDALDDDPVAVGAVAQELGRAPALTYPLIRQDTALGAWVYQQLGKGWLRWMVAIPAATNPVLDQTGAACGIGQAGPVWYLAGTFGGSVTRSCDVPFGKLLYFPLVNAFSTVPPFAVTPETDEAYWTAQVTPYLLGTRTDTCALRLRLDGREILADTAARDLALWTAVLDPFPVVLAEAGIYGDFPGGVWPLGYFGGHYALFAPLTRGDHTLEFGGARCDAGTPFFEVSATYHLHVQ
ncbi:MAG: hypothetical protein R3B06_04020 [Kofleriaceae bacterium]